MPSPTRLPVCSPALSGLPARVAPWTWMPSTKPASREGDFYQYSLGKWHAANPIPASRTRWGKRWAGADGNEEVVKTILDGMAEHKFAPLEPLLLIASSVTTRDKLQPALEALVKAGSPQMVDVGPSPYTNDPNTVIAGVAVVCSGCRTGTIT